jgi:lysophospholipase L1-like esterase
MMKKHPDWLVLNRGIDGQRSDQILARFEKDVLNEFPRYVIILAGVNDVYQGWAGESVQRNLNEMYVRAVSAAIRPVVSTILPYNSMSLTEATEIRSINDWILARAHELGIPYCDTNRVVSNPANSNQLNGSSDGLHPDVSGYRLMGEALARTIEDDVTIRPPK